MSDNDPIASLLSVADALKLDYADVAAAFLGTQSPTDAATPTLAEFIDRVLPTLNKGTARGYRTHFVTLRDGMDRQCSCTCTACLDAFEDHGSCDCACSTCVTAVDFPARGDRLMKDSSFTRTELDRLVLCAQRHAEKRARIGNRRRAQRNLPALPEHGQGGQEQCVSALRCLFGRAVDDRLLSSNPAAKLNKGARSETKRRALTIDELEEVFGVVVSGGDDVDLDFGLIWLLVESAARRTGVLALTMGSIQVEAQMITLHEKGNKVRQQPVSAKLIDYLLSMAEVRGGARCVPGSADYDPSAPLLYSAKSTPAKPIPMGRKRFDALFGRIQQALPWAAEAQVTAHSLRHTTATLVERTSGYQVAKHFLGHGSRTATDAYTKGSKTDIANALVSVIGLPHPDAST